jgi:hypothetical protein
MSAKPDGTDLAEVHSVDRYIKGLHISATHVYWTEWDGTTTPEVYRVMKKQLAGGTAQVLASQSGRSFNNLVADEANSVVYVVTAEDIHSTASELRRVSVNGGSLTTVLSLEGQVTAMALNVSGNTLPVTLLQYDARLLPNKTGELRWVTGSEQAVAHFRIEKSTDGRRFAPAGTVAARGTTAGITQYTWTDHQLAAGDNFYRLSEVSPEGKTKELGIRRIRLAAQGGLQLYPNPATGSFVTVNTGYAVTGKLTYQLLDATGRAVTTGTLTQQYQQIETGRLPKGFYLLSLGDGQQIQFTVN